MKNVNGPVPFSQQELRKFIFPITVTAIVAFATILFESLVVEQPAAVIPAAVSMAGILYLVFIDRLIQNSPQFRINFRWLNPIISGIGVGTLPYLIPAPMNEFFHILSMMSIIGIAITNGRSSAYLNLGLIFIISLPHYLLSPQLVQNALHYFSPFIICYALVESIGRGEGTSRQHIHRLETINKVSRQIMMSLDTEQTISLLSATVQDAMDADTYYIGIVKDGEVHLDLFYDDGEYFNGTRIPLEGTLTGWVIRNQKELFLPDLRKEIKLEGVGNFIIGKKKQSLSWMGVPLKAVNVTGVMALASYKPNAFDAADMELLSNLAQHVTLALDNTLQHALVEEQARLDSMTGVYNHAYFLEQLTEQAEHSLQTKSPLSLIMLDIDYFKQFNDTYGHLAGDRILNALCMFIKQHIKHKDAVGRWGGEEFIISLVGATGSQAVQVARRICETLSELHAEDRNGGTIPVPTVSQGIAVFPDEAEEIFSLIDLADRRLYIAKERGRNQIEPDMSYWKEKPDIKPSDP